MPFARELVRLDTGPTVGTIRKAGTMNLSGDSSLRSSDSRLAPTKTQDTCYACGSIQMPSQQIKALASSDKAKDCYMASI
jgi:hypothetical protein